MDNLPVPRRSIVALIVTGIYILIAVGAFAVMFMAKEDESMAGIFVVLVAMPWTTLLPWTMEYFSLDSIAFNTVFSVLACMLNAWIIYAVISFISRRLRR